MKRQSNSDQVLTAFNSDRRGPSHLGLLTCRPKVKRRGGAAARHTAATIYWLLCGRSSVSHHTFTAHLHTLHLTDGNGYCRTVLFFASPVMGQTFFLPCPHHQEWWGQGFWTNGRLLLTAPAETRRGGRGVFPGRAVPAGQLLTVICYLVFSPVRH